MSILLGQISAVSSPQQGQMLITVSADSFRSTAPTLPDLSSLDYVALSQIAKSGRLSARNDRAPTGRIFMKFDI